MGLITLLGFGSYITVSSIVGLRLLLLARRTREIPEFAMGGSLFGGSLGYCFWILATTPGVLSDGANQASFIAGVTCLNLSVALLLLGIGRIFRPGKRWAAALLAVGSVVLLVQFCLATLSYDPAHGSASITFWLFNSVAAPCYSWSTFECFRYHAQLRKRARLGLAEPEMVHRLLLWGFAGGAALLMAIIAMINRIAVGRSIDPTTLVAQSLMGLICATTLWLSFLPPAAYLRAVTGEKAPV